MKLKIELPNSWNDVTIGEYIDISQITPGLTEVEYVLNVLNILTGEDIVTLSQILPEEMNKIANVLSFMLVPPNVNNLIKEFNINGVKYTYNREFDKMTVGEQISYEILLEKDKLTDVQALPYLLSIILRKEDETSFNADNLYERAELFNHNLSIAQTIGILFFFKNGGRTYTEVLEDSLKELREMRKTMMMDN